MDNPADIAEFLRERGILFREVSDNMILFGFDETFMCGNISFYDEKPLCRMFYPDGDKKYFKNFYFDPEVFMKEYTAARTGYFRLKNDEADKLLSILD